MSKYCGVIRLQVTSCSVPLGLYVSRRWGDARLRARKCVGGVRPPGGGRKVWAGADTHSLAPTQPLTTPPAQIENRRNQQPGWVRVGGVGGGSARGRPTAHSVGHGTSFVVSSVLHLNRINVVAVTLILVLCVKHNERCINMFDTFC